jgi:hypothetical protein
MGDGSTVPPLAGCLEQITPHNGFPLASIHSQKKIKIKIKNSSMLSFISNMSLEDNFHTPLLHAGSIGIHYLFRDH